MKKTFNYLAITSCFILGTALAHADADSSQGNMYDKMFKAMDTNSDGMVTRDEFNAFGAKKFKEMDVNNNGQITLEEMKAPHKKMMGGERKKMDDTGMDSSGKARSQMESATPKSETSTAGRNNDSCCWSPDSGANKSGKKTGDSWDKKKDDARNKKMDDDDDDDDDD